MDATYAFYRALGLEIPDDAIWRTSTGIHHIDITMPSGLIVHFDSPQLAVVYNRGWSAPTGTGTRNVLSFKVAERDDVDALHRRLADSGYTCTQEPFDAFWGARYAIFADPDGNHVGIMSPSDPPTGRRLPTCDAVYPRGGGRGHGPAARSDERT